MRNMLQCFTERWTILRTKLCNFNTAISFVDRDGIADWATEPIRILSSVGLFQGTAQKKIEPKNAISIEQAIVLSYRGMLLVQDKTQK